MVRKIKNMKKISLRRRGYVIITDDLTLPIYTVGDVTLRDAKMEFTKSRKLPKLKSKLATKEQIDDMVSLGYELKNNRVTVTEWDKDSNEFLDFLSEADTVEKYMPIAVNIDFLYPIVRGKKLWEVLDLESETDYFGMCKFIESLDLDSRYASAILNTISGIRNSNCRTYADFEKQLQEDLENKEKEEV